MNEIIIGEGYIDRIESQEECVEDISRHLATIQELQKKIKEEFLNILDVKTINAHYRPFFNILSKYWMCPIKWDLTIQLESKDKKLRNVTPNYKLLISTTSKEIYEKTTSQVSNIRKILDNVYLNVTEESLLDKLDKLYNIINNEDDKKDLQKLITKNFQKEAVKGKQICNFSESLENKRAIEDNFNQIKEYCNGTNDGVKISDFLEKVNTLNEIIRTYIVEGFDNKTIHADYISFFKLMVQYWTCPIVWNVDCDIDIDECKYNDIDQLIMTCTPQYKCFFNSSLDDIFCVINDFISELDQVFGRILRTGTERYLLESLHRFYRDVNAEYRLAVQTLICDIFDVKYVKHEGKYQSVEYFTPLDSDVTEQEVREEALVSNKQDDICIVQGLVLNPRIE